MLYYFNFKEFNSNYLLTNDFGNYCFLSKNEFKELINNQDVENTDKSKELEEKGFIYNCSREEFIIKYTDYIRSMKQYIFHPTSLHIFVVTTDCNGDCVYCQAKSHLSEKRGYMTKDTAKRAVDIALTSPCDNMSFEFQGGEPLMNFDVIRYIVDYTNSITKKHISFNIVSNLTMLNEEMIEYIVENNITLSTSLDGPSSVHNINRPFLRSGKGMYELVKERIMSLNQRNIHIGAIQTTTFYSLNKSQETIDEYVSNGMNSIFIRPLTPLGMAAERWSRIGYTPEQFCEFYRKALEYIIDLNKKGFFMSEGHARIFLRKILYQFSENYMELRSPCGGALGQLAYYHDGNIYTCDEARMLAEMGDDIFKVGNVNTENYADIISSSACKAVCKSSVTETLPSCHQCVYNVYCGVCPVVNYAGNQDIYETSPSNYRCRLYRGMLDVLFDLIDNEENLHIFETWIE